MKNNNNTNVVSINCFNLVKMNIIQVPSNTCTINFEIISLILTLLKIILNLHIKLQLKSKMYKFKENKSKSSFTFV